MDGFYHHFALDKPKAPLSADQLELERELRAHVHQLANEFGQRNLFNYSGLLNCAAYIRDCLAKAGYEVQSQDYTAYGELFTNLWVEIEGSDAPDSIIVVGAHYDTVPGTPGADDNGSAVAGLLALAKRARVLKPKLTLRFVAFVNEEPPYFMTNAMGSHVYAQQCYDDGDQIEGMVCLEMLGYFKDEPGSQLETHGILPGQGDFIALAGNPESIDLIKRSAAAFEKATVFPFQAVALSPVAVAEMAFSDHWSFWQFGWPAFMVTDTGPLRNPHYHQDSDLPDTLDYDGLTRVVTGVEGIIEELVS